TTTWSPPTACACPASSWPPATPTTSSPCRASPTWPPRRRGPRASSTSSSASSATPSASPDRPLDLGQQVGLGDLGGVVEVDLAGAPGQLGAVVGGRAGDGVVGGADLGIGAAVDGDGRRAAGQLGSVDLARPLERGRHREADLDGGSGVGVQHLGGVVDDLERPGRL